jgi:hypothetical protein
VVTVLVTVEERMRSMFKPCCPGSPAMKITPLGKCRECRRRAMDGVVAGGFIGAVVGLWLMLALQVFTG